MDVYYKRTNDGTKPTILKRSPQAHDVGVSRILHPLQEGDLVKRVLVDPPASSMDDFIVFGSENRETTEGDEAGAPCALKLEEEKKNIIVRNKNRLD